MKPEQLNRLMRVNGRMQPWFVRNTNELYDSAVKSYYEKGGASVLPYHLGVRGSKMRQENYAPVRTIKAMERDRYPFEELNSSARNKQSKGDLLDTVMWASRQRSMSFNAARHPQKKPNSNIYGQPMMSASSSSCSSAWRTDDVPMQDVELRSFTARSASMPSRPRREHGTIAGNRMTYLNSCPAHVPSPPSHWHHMHTIEKTTAGVGRQRIDNDAESHKLMVVDKALKERLAKRFDRRREGERATRHRLDGLAPRPSKRRPEPYSLRKQRALIQSETREHSRFHTLGERIRQFGHIQFADGPVHTNAFHRTQANMQRQQQGVQGASSHNKALHLSHMQRIRSGNLLAQRYHQQEPPAVTLSMPKSTQRNERGSENSSDDYGVEPLDPNAPPLDTRAPAWRSGLHALQQQQELLKRQLLFEHRSPNGDPLAHRLAALGEPLSLFNLTSQPSRSTETDKLAAKRTAQIPKGTNTLKTPQEANTFSRLSRQRYMQNPPATTAGQTFGQQQQQQQQSKPKQPKAALGVQSGHKLLSSNANKAPSAAYRRVFQAQQRSSEAEAASEAPLRRLQTAASSQPKRPPMQPAAARPLDEAMEAGKALDTGRRHMVPEPPTEPQPVQPAQSAKAFTAREQRHIGGKVSQSQSQRQAMPGESKLQHQKQQRQQRQRYQQHGDEQKQSYDYTRQSASQAHAAQPHREEPEHNQKLILQQRQHRLFHNCAVWRQKP